MEDSLKNKIENEPDKDPARDPIEQTKLFQSLIKVEEAQTERLIEDVVDASNLRKLRPILFWLMIIVVVLFYLTLYAFIVADMLYGFNVCESCVIGGSRDYLHAAELIVLAAVPTLIVIALAKSVFKRYNAGNAKDEAPTSASPIQQVLELIKNAKE
jgi:heme/copper-type cytochrome/quinol oxidase subunit 2